MYGKEFLNMVLKPNAVVDIAKPGPQLQNLTGMWNARVLDGFTPFVVQFKENGLPVNLTDLNAFIEGDIGEGHYDSETDDIVMTGTPKSVRYTDDGSGNTNMGIVVFRLPPQFFIQTGIFKGFIGLQSSTGIRSTSNDVWFKVLGNSYTMGISCKFFISDFQKALDQANGKMNNALIKFNDDNEKFTQSMRESLDALKSQIQANRDEQENLNQHLISTDQKIAAGDVVTQSEWNAKNDWLVNRANEAVTQFTKSPMPYNSLDDLKKAYPNGASGVYLTMDNKHIYVWFNSDWQDCGAYPAQGVVDPRSKVNRDINKDNCKPPYDDANTFPVNSTVVVSDSGAAKNLPSKQMQTIVTIKEADNGFHGAIQLAVDAQRNMYVRYSTQVAGNYGSWMSANRNSYSVVSEQDLANYNASDLSKLPANSTFTFNIDHTKVKVLPDGWTDNGFVVNTIGNPTNDGCIQIINDSKLNAYWRITWKWPPAYQEWKPLYNNRVVTNLNLSAFNWDNKYQNMDNLPFNSRIVFSESPSVHNLINIPDELKYIDTGFVIESNNQSPDSLSGGDYQRITSQNKQVWIRFAWGYPAKFGTWRMVKTYPDKYYAKPSLAMFESIAVFGDSYTTGTTDFDNTWRSSTKIAWPSIMARKNGINLNDSYALGGITTKDWLDKFEADFLKSQPVDLYIIALGINDAIKRYAKDHTFLGAITDINNSQQIDSFYWYYSKIIKDIKQVAPKSLIILTSLSNNPNSPSQPYIAINGAIKALADQYELPYINTNDDMLFNSNYFYGNMVGGHPVGPVYAAMANSYEKLIQNCIVNNFDYFKRYGATDISDLDKQSQPTNLS